MSLSPSLMVYHSSASAEPRRALAKNAMDAEKVQVIKVTVIFAHPLVDGFTYYFALIPMPRWQSCSPVPSVKSRSGVSTMGLI